MKRYQAVAFLLSTAMTVGSVAPVFGASNDVFGHWAEFTITKWQNEGRIGGYEDGTFKPDKSITRAEFVRLLNSAVPTSFTSSTNVSFSDVKESDWFFADVAQAVGSGVTSGFEDGTFRPGETVTRMQAAVFIAKAKGLAANEAAADGFTDAASIPAWAKGAVGAAVSAGYLSGYPDGSFGGSKGMTRAEAVSTLDRVLGGTSTSSQTPSQGEVDTTDRDSQQKEETTTTANAGDMVWTSGGSGGGSRRGSSSSSSSSSSSNTISKNVTIRNQDDADDYKGKTLTGKATIYAKDGLELNDVRFKGDVDIIANSTATASAYIGEDVAVAAGYLANINIYFEGRTNVSGKITVIKEGVPVGTQVIIRTRTPRAISAIVKALIPTKIVGFEVAQVEASAPVEIAKDAKVGTITADDGASVVAEGEVGTVNVTGDVDNIVLDGTGNTSVKVNDGAKVDSVEVKGNTNASVRVNGDATVSTVAVSDSANARVDVNDTAKVDKVDIADSATAKVDVAPEAKVDAVTSTSTAAGSEVTGTGEIGKIEAPAGTLTKGEEVTTPVEDVTVPDGGTTTPEKPDDPIVEDKTVGVEALKELTITAPTATTKTGDKVDVKGVTGVSASDDSTWTVTGTSATAKITLTAANGFATMTVDEIKNALQNCGVKVTGAELSADGKTITLEVSATVDSEPAKEISVTVKPAEENITAGAAADIDFTATVENDVDDKGVTFEVVEDNTTVAAGVYTLTDNKDKTAKLTVNAATDTVEGAKAGEKITIKVSSVADPTKTATVVINVVKAATPEEKTAVENAVKAADIAVTVAADKLDTVKTEIQKAVEEAIVKAADGTDLTETEAANWKATVVGDIDTSKWATGENTVTGITFTLTKGSDEIEGVAAKSVKVTVEEAKTDIAAEIVITGFTTPVKDGGLVADGGNLTVTTTGVKVGNITDVKWTGETELAAVLPLTADATYQFKTGTDAHTFKAVDVKDADGNKVGTISGSVTVDQDGTANIELVYTPGSGDQDEKTISSVELATVKAPTLAEGNTQEDLALGKNNVTVTGTDVEVSAASDSWAKQSDGTYTATVSLKVTEAATTADKAFAEGVKLTLAKATVDSKISVQNADTAQKPNATTKVVEFTLVYDPAGGEQDGNEVSATIEGATKGAITLTATEVAETTNGKDVTIKLTNAKLAADYDSEGANKITITDPATGEKTDITATIKTQAQGTDTIVVNLKPSTATASKQPTDDTEVADTFTISIPKAALNLKPNGEETDNTLPGDGTKLDVAIKVVLPKKTNEAKATIGAKADAQNPKLTLAATGNTINAVSGAKVSDVAADLEAKKVDDKDNATYTLKVYEVDSKTKEETPVDTETTVLTEDHVVYAVEEKNDGTVTKVSAQYKISITGGEIAATDVAEDTLTVEIPAVDSELAADPVTLTSSNNKANYTATIDWSADTNSTNEFDTTSVDGKSLFKAATTYKGTIVVEPAANYNFKSEDTFKIKVAVGKETATDVAFTLDSESGNLKASTIEATTAAASATLGTDGTATVSGETGKDLANQTVKITLVGDTFTGITANTTEVNDTDGWFAEALPTGITAKVTAATEKEITITFSGQSADAVENWASKKMSVPEKYLTVGDTALEAGTLTISITAADPVE